ncbi:hypothetical protein VE03_08498 [Pseudogymnoascus sp. 23342-1-I1]|nr:hypothetical protein VE03_08498 [Pseudogymnoascus sp. 23342-1-I1]
MPGAGDPTKSPPGSSSSSSSLSPNADLDLLARLNALRPTTVSLDHSSPSLSISSTRHTPHTPQTPDTLLSDRLRALRNGGAGAGGRSTSSRSHLPPSDQHLTLGVLSDASEQTASAIASLDEPIVETDDRADRNLAREALDFAREGSHDVPISKSHGRSLRGGSKAPTPEDVIRRLREEAADSLSDSDKLLKSEGKHKIPKNAGSRDSDAGDSPAGQSDAEKSDGEDEDEYRDLEQEAREAEEILARLLDEAHLEDRDEAAQQPPPSPPPQSTNPPPPDPAISNDPLTLPSTPSTLLHLPDPPDPETLAFATSITARMAALQNPTIDALGMPSAPSAAPVSPPRRGPSKPAPEPATACVICYDNATVLCRGCENNFGDAEEALYCARCWKEGHLGADAGTEERAHEWIKFKRPT